jgi:hypothetical protein
MLDILDSANHEATYYHAFYHSHHPQAGMSCSFVRLSYAGL